MVIWGTRGSGRRWAVAVLLGGALGCGGGGGTGGGPATPSSPTSPSSPDAGGSGPTITITSSGVDPKEVQVAVGGRVTFVNRDNAFHEMSSDPHPLHTDCPEINVGALGPGASRQTAVFTRARTCTYHDHGQDTNTSLQGAIVVR